MQARTLTAAQGWRWLANGFVLFRQAPSRLGMVVMAYWLCILLLNAVPVLGPLATSILMPALSVGVMNACRMLERGQPFEMSVLFSGFQGNRKTLFIMGGVYLLCSLGALGLSALADDGLLLSVMTGQTELDESVLSNPAFLLSSLVVLGCLLPVLMAYWYAPMLAAWYNLPLGKSLFFSFIACQRNWAAFLAYSLALFAYAALLPVTLIALVGMLVPASAGFMSALLILPMLMVLGPTVLASFYVSYRDVFAVSENA